MTTKQLNKLHSEKYIMTDGMFFIAALDENFKHTITQNKSEAVVWTYADTVSSHKLEMARIETRLSKLSFVEL